MKKPLLLTALKILLCIPIGYALMLPFLSTNTNGGVLDQKNSLPIWISIVIVVVFLVLVYLYVRDLQKTLKSVSPIARKASPRSVWLMFVIPYNFIEDFFIIRNVANSLQAEAKINPCLAKYRHFGMSSGIGWCSAQIVSLLPNNIGAIAGIVALILWIYHWRFIRKINKVLV